MGGVLVLFLWVLYLGSCFKSTDVMVTATSWFVPLLTYEKQYGKLDMEYSGNYEIDASGFGDEEKTTQEQGISTQEHIITTKETEEEQKKEDTVKETSAIVKGQNCVSFTMNQLKDKDFLRQKIFVIDRNTSMTDEELSVSNLLDTDLSVKDLKEWDGSQKKKCKILIYHTHGSEAFRDSRPGVTEDTVIGVGSYLTQILEEKYGIPVYHDTTVYDMINGVNDRSGAYENAYQSVTKILEQNPSIEVVIDLHRDGVDDDIQLVTDVDGKRTAKIMFLNGVSRSNTNGEIAYLKNPNRKENLAFSFQMYLKGKERYGDYIRKIYVKSLRFNMHLMPRTTLIEAGAQNNTIEEEKNAMEPLADILNAVLSGEK
ncbi:MAG: stage II sporulation protein P [Eubacteriales bacterium]|nr:stage II sporulation protein P [Eubacteriales bacterium]